MAKVKSKKANPATKKVKVDERGNIEMVMLLIVTLGLAITTIMSFSR